MNKRIAVETLTLGEVSEMFFTSIDIAYPKAKGYIEHYLKKVNKLNIKAIKWIKPYEEFKGAKLNFYCQKIQGEESPIVSIGMTHRTKRGLILIAAGPSNGGIPTKGYQPTYSQSKWVKIFTGHFCERYAERIVRSEKIDFKTGSEAIMFSDLFGPVRITDNVADGLDEIEFQFREGQAYGYRDSNSRISYFRTVYSNDMLKRDRLEFKKEWEHTLEELKEVFSWNR